MRTMSKTKLLEKKGRQWIVVQCLLATIAALIPAFTSAQVTIWNTQAEGVCATAVGNSTDAIGDYAIAMGDYSAALGDHSIAMGYSTEVSADAPYGVTMGYQTTAEDDYAVAMGYMTHATGKNTTAMGYKTTAQGRYSTAMGYETMAAGKASTAMGYWTDANAYADLAVGRFNEGLGNGTTWIETDPLFEVGIGLSNEVRQNALTLLKNGFMGINDSTPEYPLQVLGGSDETLAGGGYFVAGSTTSKNIVIDTDEIMARNNTSTTSLYLQHNGGNVYVGGALAHSSDRRLKYDIRDLNVGLDEVCRLQPVSYYWKDRIDDSRRIGLIAQDVQQVSEESVSSDADGILGVDYTSLIPILINAVKSLDQNNRALEERYENLNADLTTDKERYGRLAAEADALNRSLDDQHSAMATQIIELAAIEEENRQLARLFHDQDKQRKVLRAQFASNQPRPQVSPTEKSAKKTTW